MPSTSQIGALGESLAVETLVSQGYVVIERNWRCAYGEIDIVAVDTEVWVFVEVKTRISAKFGQAVEAITAQKKSRLINASYAYLNEHNIAGVAWRLDVVAIQLTPSRQVKSIDIYRNAIEE